MTGGDLSRASDVFPKKDAPPRVLPVKPADSTTAMPPPRDLFIEQAMAAHESALIGYAATLLHNSDLARDVVQDTFLRLCQQDVAQVCDHLKPWLFTVCRNRALDLLRKDHRSQPLEAHHWHVLAAPGLQPDAHAERAERLARVYQALGRLSTNQRAVII